MKLLYLGDVMGKSGRDTVKRLLPNLRNELAADFVVAQGENLSHGKGMSMSHVTDMQAAGIDFFTAGNWTLHRPEIIPWLIDPAKPVIRCANYPADTPGRGYKIVDTPFGRILVASLLGQIVGAFQVATDNPLLVIDEILEQTKHEKLIARIVNFHGDYSSEKLVIGQYLDGKVSMVVGDHWHVPTADAKILPLGTAHITDVGMVGSADSCLGVRTDVIIARWKSGQNSRNELEDRGAMRMCAILVDIDTSTGLARHAEQIIRFA